MPERRRRGPLAGRMLLLILYLHCGSAFAVGGDEANPRANAMILLATPIQGHDLSLDGRLDEAAWQQARFVSSFVQRDPDEGQPAKQPTEVAILYDQEALYIGARLFCQNVSKLRRLLTRRDNAGSAERFLVSLDTYGDRRTAYTFGVTAAGVRFDYYHPEDNERRREYSYNPIWEAKTIVDDQGWCVEIRIPFSQLRFSDRREQVWGVNFNRYIPLENEDDYWILVPKNETGWSSRFGTIMGLEGIKSTRRLEILPYVAGDLRIRGEFDAGNPFLQASESQQRLGADFKVGLGPNLTLDMTVNPDFGQVEADPAEVNLSAFETFFDERRPFFTEGSQLFNTDGPGYFYSRRIGARPHGDPSAEFSQRLDNTTILGAAKITGRLVSGLSIGALSAVTARETARTYDTATQQFGQARIEPLTGYGVLRLQQEFGRSQSTAGLIFTGVSREMHSGESLAEILTRQAYAGGGDWNLRFQGGKYEFSGYAGFSYLEGDAAAVAGIQQSSSHYFQRPDQSHVAFDPGRTSLSGYTAGLRFSKNSGAHWLWGVGGSADSPGFELNDAGRLSTADDASIRAQLTYRETRPGGFFRNYAVTLSASRSYNFGGVHLGSSLELESRLTWKNFWNIRLRLQHAPRGLSDRLTRGGPLMGTPDRWEFNARLSNYFSAGVRWRLRTGYDWDELGGWQYDVSGGFSFYPTSRLELAFDPDYSESVNARQYATTLEGGHAETFGNRYIFAALQRRTLSMRLRMNFALTPDMSLEIYAEPFVASGAFDRWGELSEPRSLALRRYGTEATRIRRNEDGSLSVTEGANAFELENRDFNVLSFRSNFVLRWEWLPGSTLYFVWQQNRGASEEFNRQVRPADLFDTFSAPGDNFLALKIAYWLPVD